MHVHRTNPLPIVGVSHMTHQHWSTRLAIWARFTVATSAPEIDVLTSRRLDIDNMVGVITNERYTHVMNSAPRLGDLVCPAGNDCDDSHLVRTLK